jgi:hypothetical protein
MKSPGAPVSKPNRLLFWGALAAMAVLVVLARSVTYDEPLENDVAGYEVTGREMDRGRPLYSDLWDRKPPLLYGVFAVAHQLTTSDRQAVFGVNIAASLASLVAVAAAGRAMSGATAGLLAAGWWTLLGGDLYLQANQPNAEALVNPCLTAAVALLMARLNRPTARSLPGCAAIGALLGAATLIKHHVAAGAGVMLLGYVAAGGRAGVFRRIADTAVAAGVICLCWGVTIAWFAATGRMKVFIDILAGRDMIGYVGNPLVNLLRSLEPSAIAIVSPWWMAGPVLLLAGALVFADRSALGRGVVVMMAAWVAAAWLCEALPGHLFGHYFQYWIPVWAVTGGIAAAALMAGRATVPAGFRHGLVVTAFGIALIRQSQPYTLTPDQWADEKYPGGNYTQQKYLGRDLRRKILLPGETFWVAGDDTSLYFESGQSPPTGVMYVDPLVAGPAVREYNDRLVRDLSAHPPDLILLTPLIERFPQDAPIFDWLKRNYEPWEKQEHDPWPASLWSHVYHLLVRRGSPLARRVMGSGK